jgi:hypothetical protein
MVATVILAGGALFTPVYSGDDNGIANEIKRHNGVMEQYEKNIVAAGDKLKMELKTCTTAKERQAQQDAYARDVKQIKLQMLMEDLAFMMRLAELGADEAAQISDDIQKIEKLGGDDSDKKQPTMTINNNVYNYTAPGGTNYTWPPQITENGLKYDIVPGSLRMWKRPYVEYRNGDSYYVKLGKPG